MERGWGEVLYLHMRHIYLLSFLLLLPFGSLLAQTAQPTDADRKLIISLAGGYATEDLNWSIAGNAAGKNPNILSELIWKDLKGPAISLNVKYKFWRQVFVESSFSSKFTTSGQVTDTDYGEDNRNGQSFRVVLHADAGQRISSAIAVGYNLPVVEKLLAAFSVGYALDKQWLYLKDYNESDEPLNSSYKTKWGSVFFKVEPSYQLSRVLSLAAFFKYYQATYDAKGNWNLISDFQHPVSYTHDAKGYGVEAQLKANYRIGKNLSVFVSGDYLKWNTGKGNDKLYRTNGQVPLTQLNEVNRKGYGFNAGLNMLF